MNGSIHWKDCIQPIVTNMYWSHWIGLLFDHTSFWYSPFPFFHFCIQWDFTSHWNWFPLYWKWNFPILDILAQSLLTSDIVVDLINNLTFMPCLCNGSYISYIRCHLICLKIHSLSVRFPSHFQLHSLSFCKHIDTNWYLSLVSTIEATIFGKR